MVKPTLEKYEEVSKEIKLMVYNGKSKEDVFNYMEEQISDQRSQRTFRKQIYMAFEGLSSGGLEMYLEFKEWI